MNRWFVVHNLLSYRQHPDMIGNVTRNSGVAEPRFSKFGEIQKGDLVVYYATKDKVVVGIFEVVSDMEYLPNDPYWNETTIYKIRPVELPTSGKYLDFKKLVSDPDVHLDMFPKRQKWGSYLQGRTCKLLTEGDYSTIRDALSKEKYLKEEITRR